MTELKKLLPKEPMAPISISTDRIPEGEEWGYQLKWDGVRILSLIEDGNITLISRSMLNKTRLYPEVTSALSGLKDQRLLLDGEVVYFHPELGRPVFQKVLQRERSRTVNAQAPRLTYVLFDILIHGDEDLRPLPYIERHERLKDVIQGQQGLLLADLFQDGNTLWSWAEERNWEGIVIKKLSAPYREGKKHQDWFKKKTSVILDAEAPALIIRDGRAASLVVTGEGGAYIGRASLGLNDKTRQLLLAYAKQYPGTCCLSPLPSDLHKEQLSWLSKPLQIVVTFLEWSQDGVMRHPKLVDIKGLKTP
ncbi:RNA ligase family protein [Paenibacillus lemnae]|uniref:DNA ligase n=1 Tax=Paenibacillus lemnae TaxID=1330551 RepID=A0A848M6B2_PAELE|nr:RNA ligase family protein [Paenibacillus lemnae]NMO95730.1 DNA ligase [Paenibacillus lemnae]